MTFIYTGREVLCTILKPIGVRINHPIIYILIETATHSCDTMAPKSNLVHLLLCQLFFAPPVAVAVAEEAAASFFLILILMVMMSR